MSKRLLGFVLAICLLASFLPAVSANEAVATYGPSVGIGASAVQNDGTVYYGSDGRWVVLDAGYTTTDVEGLALLSQDIVDADIAFHTGGLDNSWANSNAKAWNSQYAEKTFSAAELAAILDTTKAEQSGAFFGFHWGKDALDGEKLFFLSAAEVNRYFSGNLNGLIASADGVADGWWLRSANTDREILGGIVSDSGFVGTPHVAATWGARPAFNISADNIVLSSAAQGGKVSGTVGADSLTAVAEASVNGWKLTAADDAHKAFTATIGDGSGTIQQSIDYTSWQLPVAYSGAVAGENEYVSLLLCDNLGTAVYYGHIANNSVSGTVNVNMPLGLSGKYTVYVLAEQCNEGNATDFGSAAVAAEIEITDGLGTVDSWGLVLEGDIRADFMMELTDTVLSDPEAYVSVTVDGVETVTKVSDIEPENGQYRVKTNVAAAQMTESINIQVVTSERAGSEYVYSVQKYGNYILKSNQDAETKDLVKAMLNYGGKAQNYFSYNLDAKADNGLSIQTVNIPDDKCVPIREGASDNVKFYGASLLHQNQTGVRFYFTSTDEKIANVTFSTAGNDNMTVKKLNGMYCVDVMNISPDKLDELITVTADGLSISYSPYYYINRQYYRASSSLELRELMLAMYNYYTYAEQYVASGV